MRAILLSQSSDGGETWSDPVAIVVPDTTTEFAFGENFSDPWIAVDPSNHKRLYISYIHGAIHGDASSCPHQYQVEVVSSTDGGQTFDPTARVLDSECFTFGGLVDVGTRMAISSSGRVTVAWLGENNLAGLFEQEILVNSFVPGGSTPAPTIVDAVFQGGSIVLEVGSLGNFNDINHEEEILAPTLQGGIYNIRGFDMAVDHSGGPTDGTVYLVWDDSRNGQGLAPELEDIFGLYNFTDILYAVSTDGGQTFTPTRQLNSDLQPTITRGHDHYRPAAAVDGNGTVAACWYDRRNDPQNYQFERFCAESKNAGGTWTEFTVPGSLSTPVILQDVLFQANNSTGENDNLTSDFNGHAPGFIGGIQWMSSGMNPDVKEVRFR